MSDKQANASKILQNREAALAALQWQVDENCADLILSTPADRTKPPSLSDINEKLEQRKTPAEKPLPPKSTQPTLVSSPAPEQPDMMYESSHSAAAAAQKLAEQVQTLEELEAAIRDFTGLSVRDTATNMVFADGNPKGKIMVIGEAPGADEDRQGKPFVGASGQLLDRIFASIGLSRSEEDPHKAIYISNILNWRPPGNRTPTAQEIVISLPFIERHIALIAPEYLVLCGATPGKSLLRRTDSISKLRGTFHAYLPPQNLQKEPLQEIKVMATYHPAYLLRTPIQKKAVWQDMLMLKGNIAETL
jgi:DNA polymerase